MSQARSAHRSTNVRWNITVNTIDLIFFGFAISMVTRETVVPLLVSKLTDSPVLIGLIPALYSLAIYLPQLFGASVATSMPYKKPFVAFWGGIGERVPYLLISIMVLLLAQPTPQALFVLLVILYSVSGFSTGFATPAWFDMYSKVIPLERRGLFAGLGHGIGALLGVAGAAVIAYVLEQIAYPQNFAILYGFAALALAISWLGLVLTREPPTEQLHAAVPIGHYLRNLPAILRRDTNFRGFIAAYSLLSAGAMASGFYLVYGSDRFNLGGTEVGILTAVLIGTQAILNLLAGALGDRRGHKLVLVLGGVALGIASLLACLASSWLWLLAVFGFLGAFLATGTASFLTILPEFCAEPDRPTYIGLTNTILAPVTALAPLLGGVLVATFGYLPMFVVAGMLALSGVLMLTYSVREPRYE
jgi:MFS family permease